MVHRTFYPFLSFSVYLCSNFHVAYKFNSFFLKAKTAYSFNTRTVCLLKNDGIGPMMHEKNYVTMGNDKVDEYNQVAENLTNSQNSKSHDAPYCWDNSGITRVIRRQNLLTSQ